MAAQPPHRHNLPAPVSSFIGREQELEEISALLNQRRLVTLTGSGGTGKTRLALRAATAVVEQFDDGVWLAALAPLTAAELVCDTIAKVVGAPEVSAVSLLEALAAHLERKRLLLILDNCEHVLAECAHVVATLLARCPSLVVLATSREPLTIGGETALRVPPLSVPDPSEPLDLGRLLEFHAVRLFVERAQAAEHSFRLTSVSAVPIVEICRRLDGIPLALELAAVRVRGMGVAYLAARLDDRFHLLTEGDRASAPRQRALLAMVDWSYGLLSERERVTLRRLSVFRGGFAPDAAEVVCSGDYEGGEERAGNKTGADLSDQTNDEQVHGRGTLSSDAVLAALTRLVDKSLAQLDHDTGRYRLLETIHLYARQRLAAAGETNFASRQHVLYYLRLLEDGAGLVGGPGEEAWFKRLALEHDNVRAALDWTLQSGRADEAAQLAMGLWPFWRARAYQREGLRWLEQIVAPESAAPLPTDVRPRLFNAMGVLAHMARRFGPARTYHAEALRLWTESGDHAGMARALIDMGWQHFEEVELPQTKQCAIESLPLAESSGDQRLIASALLLNAIADLHADIGLLLGFNVRSETDASRFLGMIPPLERSLTIWRELGDLSGEATTLAALGLARLGTREYERAKPLLAESARLHVRLHDYGNITGTLVVLMNLAAYGSEAPESARDAARMFGVLGGLARSSGSESSPWDTSEPARKFTERLIGSLGREGFEQMLAEGAQFTPDTLLALVDRMTAPDPRVAPPRSAPPPTPARAPHDDLTPRELEVLHLVAEGLTSAQIAQALVVTPRTVGAHLTAIYAKLDVTSRAGAIKYALEHHVG